MFLPGDIVELEENLGLVHAGLYRVLVVGTGAAQLSPIDPEEKLGPATFNRTLFVPTAVLEQFRVVEEEKDEIV